MAHRSCALLSSGSSTSTSILPSQPQASIQLLCFFPLWRIILVKQNQVFLNMDHALEGCANLQKYSLACNTRHGKHFENCLLMNFSMVSLISQQILMRLRGIISNGIENLYHYKGYSLVLNRRHVVLEDMLYFFENLNLIQEPLN